LVLQVFRWNANDELITRRVAKEADRDRCGVTESQREYLIQSVERKASDDLRKWIDLSIGKRRERETVILEEELDLRAWRVINVIDVPFSLKILVVLKLLSGNLGGIECVLVVLVGFAGRIERLKLKQIR
jgi:hypothetical protein